MKASFKLRDPGKMEAQLTLTMTLYQWQELQNQLQWAWPSSQLSSAITDVLQRATARFSYDQEGGGL